MRHIRVLFLSLSGLILAGLILPPNASAADFHWQDTNGASHSLQEYEGRPLLLHFWATWCPPCRTELPELALWQEQHPEALIVPVSLDENPQAGQQYLQQSGLDLPANGGDSQQAMRLGVRGLPSTFVVSANGDITRRYLGAQPWTDKTFGRGLITQLAP